MLVVNSAALKRYRAAAEADGGVIPWYYGGSQVGSVVGRLGRSRWLASGV
jgi:hypothetical protein